MDLIAKTREDYNRFAKHYAQTRPHVWADLLQFKSFLHNGQRILDWGCGHGRLLELFAGLKIEYFGLDQSRELLSIARRDQREAILAGRAHFFCTAGRPKKFPDGYFDLAFFIASFFHLPDKAARLALLKKTYRELKPGGRLIITVWNLASAWAKQKKFGWTVLGKNDFLIPWKNPAGKIIARRYYHHFTPNELSRLLSAAGFSVERLEFMSRAFSSDSKGGRNLIAVARKPRPSA